MLMDWFYKKQRELDDKIIKNMFECSIVTQQDHVSFLPQMMLAALVEVGEFIDERDKEKKLFEMIDVFHFFLSNANALEIDLYKEASLDVVYTLATVKRKPAFGLKGSIYLIDFISKYADFCNKTRCFKVWSIKGPEPMEDIKDAYMLALMSFFRMAYSHGYTAEDIERAYMEKNKINHDRQNSGSY